MKNTLTLVFLLTCVVRPASAGDITTSLRDGRIEESAYVATFELGLVAGYINNPHVNSKSREDDWLLDMEIAGEFRRKNFFLETAQGTQDGVNLGYTLWHNEDWAIDFLAASMAGGFRDLDNDSSNRGDSEAARNARLEDQDTFYLGTGFRVTRYLEDYVVQYRLVTDTWRNNGVISTLRIGRGWQIRNWHLGTILSAQYTSEKTANYWIGVEEDEATGRYPAFEADDTMYYTVFFNVTKPLSQKWVWRGFVGMQFFPDKSKESPLLDNSDLGGVVMTFNYVFF